MDIRNASVLITGGSRGLGRALADTLAREGAKVVLVARGAGDLMRASAEIRASYGWSHAIAADVSDKSAVYSICGEAAAVAGPVDILVLNASTLGPTPLRELLDTECEDLEHVMHVNLVGPFRLAKAVAGSMAIRRRGLILGISSDASVEPYPGWGAYGTSKAALDHLLRILGKEMDGSGVHVLSVDPGEMDTQMHEDAMPDADTTTLARPRDVSEKLLQIIRQPEAFPNGARIMASQLTASVAAS